MFEILAPLLNPETIVMFKATSMFPALCLIIAVLTCALRKEA